MPVISGNYIPPRVFRSADIATIFAAILRRVDLKSSQRERITLKDGDFIDLDWTRSMNRDTNQAVILLHGLAGNSQRPYMKGMARAFSSNNWDVISMNFRGCSHEMNRYFKSYHAGATDDVAEVIDHVINLDHYDKIGIVGFSLGGNMALKYLGEDRSIPGNIIGGVGISVPCDLEGSLGAINRTRNFVYSKRFEINLKKNLYDRAGKFPELIDKRQIANCSSLRDIDDLYTSKAHGFKDASDYYKKNSCLQFLDDLKRPALLLSAQNDSFLSDDCYPENIAKNSDRLHLEIPSFGGHVGFVSNTNLFYHEKRAVDFLGSLT